MPLYFLFIGLLLLLIVGLGVLMGSMDAQNIKAEWAKRRCEPAIMFSAFMYKPASDPRSSGTFAGDNFEFCVRSLIDEVFKEVLAPVLGVFSQQMSAAATTGGVLNSIRNQLGNAFRSFSGIFNEFFETYKRGTHQLARITAILRQAMLKVSAAVVSIVFMGMSLMISILNVKDFVIKVVIIIMSIIVALIVLLFFALIPFMPIIFTVIAILTGAGLGGAVGGMAGAFCIDPTAEVLLATGERRQLGGVCVGDQLAAGCGRVEGILQTDTVGELYNVEGITMSASHLVYFGGITPLFAHEYPGARLVSAEEQRPHKLIILNTSSHKIPLINSKGELLFAADWEEIQDEEGQEIWEKLVWEILNGSRARKDQTITTTTATITTALFEPDTTILVRGQGEVPISDIKRGMVIQDINGSSTKVLGIYIGISEEPFNYMTNGVRYYTDGIWKHIDVQAKGDHIIGYNLVTDSGSFCVITNDSHLYYVRDFTEVGWLNLDQTYESTRGHISNKKEIHNQNRFKCV